MFSDFRSDSDPESDPVLFCFFGSADPDPYQNDTDLQH